MDKYIKSEQKIKKNYLSNRGYVIYKSSLSKKDIEELKKKLTVKPNIPRHFATFVKSFKVYLENKKKIYTPKQYGIDHFGIPEKILISKGDDIKVNFKGSLRGKQKPVVKKYMSSIKSKNNKIGGGGIIAIPCGYGKCLGKDTPVLLYKGTIKKVQDIKVGDQLMGDDSKPRNVLSICKGREQLYKIHQEYGQSYVVNKSHIVSLFERLPNFYSIKKYKKIDINLEKLLKKSLNKYYGYSVRIKFPFKDTPKDAYKFGKIIGKWVQSYTECFDTENKKKFDPNMYCVEDILPYFINITMVRELFLAGFLDILGIPSKLSCISWVLYNKKNPSFCNICSIIDIIACISRSIGISVRITKVTNDLSKITFFGDRLVYIPLKTIYIYQSSTLKKSSKEYKGLYFMSKISIEKLDIGDFYGFEIDKNRRFLLGDCTVTHNTVCALNIVSKINKKTLIIVHKQFLMDQWKERIEQFLPNTRVGTIQQNTVNIRNKDIVLAMLQSLALKKYPKSQIFDDTLCMARNKVKVVKQCSKKKMKNSDYCKRHRNYVGQRIDEDLSFKSFGLCIIDECHHVAADVFSRALNKVTVRYMLGLSATPNRTDGLSKVFKWHMGPIVYQIKKRHKEELYVKCLEILSDYEPYCKTVFNYMRKPVIPTMITNICSYSKRTLLISHLIKKCYDNKRNILVLSDRREHLQNIQTALHNINITDVGFYMGGMKKEDLDKSLQNKILLGTYSMVSEGFDHKKLDTLILASPKSNIEQSIGRILRKDHVDIKPLVVDIIDTFSSFLNQGYKRKRFYKKNNYPYKNYQITDNEECQGDLLDKEWIKQIELINLEPTKDDIIKLKKQQLCNTNTDEKKKKKVVCLIMDD